MSKFAQKILKEALGGDEDEDYLDGFNDADEFDLSDEDEEIKPSVEKSVISKEKPVISKEKPVEKQAEVPVKDEVEKERKNYTSNVMVTGIQMHWRKYKKDGVEIAYKPITFMNLKTGKKNVTYNLRKGDRTEGQDFDISNRFDLTLIQAIKLAVPKVDKILLKGVKTKYYGGQNGGKIWLFPTDTTQIIVVDGKTRGIKKTLGI